MALHDLIPRHRSDPGRRADSMFSALQHEMNRLFDDFFGDSGVPSFREEGMGGMVVPRVDVSETDQEIHVSAELPGLEEKDVEVTLANGVLTLRGEKKHEHETKERNWHRVERSYGSFERSIALPAEVDLDKVDATFTNGVLHVTLAKTEQASQRRKIEVRSGK